MAIVVCRMLGWTGGQLVQVNGQTEASSEFGTSFRLGSFKLTLDNCRGISFPEKSLMAQFAFSEDLLV